MCNEGIEGTPRHSKCHGCGEKGLGILSERIHLTVLVIVEIWRLWVAEAKVDP